MNNIKWFTLVELIVVITILAILGTIAFISLSWNTQDAKNSKITTDIKSIISAIEINLVKHSLSVSDVHGTEFQQNSVTGTGMDNTVTISNTNHRAWDINFSAIKQPWADFKTPEWKAYIYSFFKWNGREYYELGGELTLPNGNNIFISKWNYIQENETTDVRGIISASGSSTPLMNGDIITGSLY